ncbi:M16 family metallopeptidase [Cerasicoccus fimbriatus]|uniref:M16 family metallopeptidase n=1 Tax=Cerasicoccus fimbriatus TaxID=3014554 RepID=UPI0022B50029|nr:pitrilysin family protein [Cerasicoccus sp. TK19100]
MPEQSINGGLIESLAQETIHRYQLDNGLTVVHKEDRSAALISVQTWVKTGSIHEGNMLGAGLSHYLEHLLFKGTEKRGPLDISREINGCGGYINAYTTFDRTVYYIDGPSSAAATIFDVLADMSLYAALPEEEIIRERDVILREIDMGLDDPDRRLFHTFAHTAFREHPYRHPVIGHRKLFEGVTPADLRAYYRGRYAPNNLVLVVVGALSENECRDLAQQHFGAAPMRQLAPAFVPDEPAQLAPRSDRATGDFNVVRGFIGYKVPGLAAADAPALDVLARLMGNGASSWLWQSLREKQRLVHNISAGCWNPGDHGLLWISYLCDPGKREAVEAAIRSEIAIAQTKAPQPEELAKIVRQSLVGEVNARKTVSGQAARLGSAEVVAGDLGFPQQHLRRLSSLTPGAIRDAANRFLVDTGETATSIEPKTTTTSAPSVNTGKGLPDFEEVTLKNGARLFLQNGGSVPKTHLRYVARGGPLWDPAGQRGATGVFATLLARDTTKRTAAEIAGAIESVGGGFEEHVGNNTFGLSLETLSGDFPLAAELLSDALHHAAYLPTTFEIERDAQIASLQEDDDEVLEWSRRQLRAKYFGQHPYAVDYLGHEDDLKALNIDHIRSLAGRLLAGPNALMAVTGQFDRNRVVDTLGPILEALPGDFAHSPCPALEAPAETGSLTLERDREQAIVLVAYPDSGVENYEAYLAGEALDELFSGMSSQLFQKVREEKGMAYFVGSQRLLGINCGMFTFYAGTSPQQADEVEREILAEVERARAGGFTGQEWSACKTRLIVRREQAQQSPASRAMHACLNALYGQPVNSWRNYPDRVRNLSLDQLTTFATERFTPDKRLIVKTLPSKR